VPRAARGYARRLLSSIVPWQRWGFSRFAARAGFATYFKGGWRGTAAGRLVHEVARFERGGERFSLAVLTDGNPSHEYGAATLRGLAARLFGADPPTRDATQPAARALQTRPGDGAAPAQAGPDPGSGEAGDPGHRRAGLVDVQRQAPGIALEIRYAGPRNLTGRRLPGYCRPWALLLEPVARDLARVQRHLRRRGLGLKVFDAYRPARATRALVRWAERGGRGELVGTYIARRSRHNAGIAVDLTLVRRGSRGELRMGGGYDQLSSRAHTLNARGRALRNRLTLQHAMQRFGFAPYALEWWHFEHRRATGPALDLPLGCG
jgi:zinc D-Ala-D-Ala dipeptidase